MKQIHHIEVVAIRLPRLQQLVVAIRLPLLQLVVAVRLPDRLLTRGKIKGEPGESGCKK